MNKPKKPLPPKRVAARQKQIDWKQVGNLVAVWAGSDSGSDELADLLDSMGVSSKTARGVFWTEFSRRLNAAFK